MSCNRQPSNLQLQEVNHGYLTPDREFVRIKSITEISTNMNWTYFFII